MLTPPSEKISAETREKLLALAEFIETDETRGFWMGTYVDIQGVSAAQSDRPECGTTACIAGFCNLMLMGSIDPQNVDEDTFERRLNDDRPASAHLSLTEDQKHELFYGSGTNDRAQAARVLRNFAYTGEVDWSV